ncbi:hypothetical protein [uncultured Draconibacterium sp.]|uniref:hypothetical protein n=1 Tax=uncultured Draconibacterium sp. TaxID=1573823 RepID=UPI003217CA18
MTTFIAYSLIAIAFASLLAYSIWWLYFSPYSVFKPMGAKNLYNSDESKKKIESNLWYWELRKKDLETDLDENGYNEAKLSQLRTIEMHITTCEQRLNGTWKTDSEYLPKIEILQ